ncbi:General substrate transporter family and Major facilitator superfamily domain, general substrate transporter and Major facilitator superfamily domain-containing protein [Strongyloides ratti]|uniref:General substrate transporter family and Major facilitator superfamily domain, general substrate transporter and Major facilitator superfamily domain-containing protein n=1 Tax=Strongyloides ratti TaxID=34506 RepID=A0A090LPC9_STRRB|nr:General substrate transporter family and Major facilitator superfamily domain, general substrate transporter and Major facilitator superfamily domain-containing protein [Strongyloides ratti]CEF70049.1 General substrate transporter family and Major facilitator superfamily domain, general substrate transporter and Major facilitator superfamily domain-containing protein [Strongyloides ratti]
MTNDITTFSIPIARSTVGRSSRTASKSFGGDIKTDNLDPDKILTSIFYATEVMIMSFIGEEISSDNCYITNLSTNKTSYCGTDGLSYFYFNETIPKTLTSQFNLVCKDSVWIQHGTSIFMIGSAIATPILTQLGDTYGRRLTFLIPLWLAVLANIGVSASTNYYLFLFFRFISGFGTGSYIQIAQVLIIESVATEFRDVSPILSNFTWFFGYSMVGVLRYFIDSWQWLYFFLTAPGILTFSYYWLIPESIHWLVQNNKTKKVNKYIKKSSELNKKSVLLEECQKKSSTSLSSDQSDTGSCSTNEISRSFMEMLMTGKIFFQLSIQCYIFILLNLTYWAISLYSTGLSEDPYKGYFLSGLVELPGGILSYFLLKKYPRKPITIAGLCGQAIFMTAAIFFIDKSVGSIVCILIAKSFNCIVWNSVPLMASEMAPTTTRNRFYGVCSFIGEFGSIIAPYIEEVKQLHQHGPAIMISLMTWIAIGAIMCAPETKNKPLPRDFDDFDEGPLLKFLKRKKKANLSTLKSKESNIEENSMIQMNNKRS